MVAPPPPLVAGGLTKDQEQALIQAKVAAKDWYYAFQRCDGYGRPAGPGGDGMTKLVTIFGTRAAFGIRRTTPGFIEPDEIADCGAALALMADHSDLWLRKVSLLRARAMHRLVVGDAAGALKDLDAADAAAIAPDDAYYRRSLKVGVDLVRAYALRVSGEKARAEALAMQAWASRPYSYEVAHAALLVLGPDAPTADTDRILRAAAEYAPLAANQLFDDTFEKRRFVDCLPFYAGIAPVPTLGDEPMAYRDRALLAQTNRADAQIFWAVESGRYAYALAALGRDDDARAALKAEADRFAASTPAAPEPAEDAGVNPKTDYAVHEQANLQIKSQTPPVIESWSKLAQARIAVNEGRLDEAWAITFPQGRPIVLTPSWATVDLLNAIAAKSPDRLGMARRVETDLQARRRAERDPGVKVLFQWLPEAETRERLAPYRADSYWQGLISGPGNGFTITNNASTGVTTVAFSGAYAPITTLEDLALLRAADLARRAGKKGLVVLARRDINHITTVYATTIPNNFEVQLDVVFVDPAQPPADYQSAAWRIIDANAVYDALAPFYIRPAGS